MKPFMFVIASMVVACNAATPPPGTGGADLPDGPCGRGMLVINSDYQSTNVALSNVEGELVSTSIISSASESTALSAPLSGDVAAPNARLVGDDLVLIDRFPSSVLTWVTIATGDVRAQLDVSTGFAANPRDYLELDDGSAYVTRFETNPAAGAAPFDAGGDILIVDPNEPSITARIDLAPAMDDAPGFLPRPSRMVRFDGDVVVLLLAYNQDFTDAAPSRLVRVDPELHAITDVTVLEGLYGCEGLAATADELAVTCSGLLPGGMTTSSVGSGLARFTGDLKSPAVVTAEALGGQPLGFAVAFTASGVLVNALGAFGESGAPDILDSVLHVAQDGSFTTSLRSSSLPFELGDIRCTHDSEHSCGACFVTDGELSALHRLDPEDGSLDDALPLEDGIGLPPRGLGRF